MTPYNPYSAPSAPYGPAPQAPVPGPYGAYGETYVPLGWRMVLASMCIVALTVFDLLTQAAQVAWGDDLVANAHAGRPDLGALFAIGLGAIATFVSLIMAAVFFGVWIHRAASNLRGLGRYGMRFSPGGCVGWFYVPIAHLFLPLQAMSELWRASDPSAGDGASWMGSRSTALLGVWWAGWIGASFVGIATWLTRDQPSTSGSFGLAVGALRAVAAIGVILLMRGIGARQEQAAQQVGAGGA